MSVEQPEVHGTCEPRFEGVRRAMAANLASGADVGASFAATIDGRMVVDLWGGHADRAATRPWERDTIVNVWSSTKTMAALCGLLLVDRGEVDLDAPVASYWPEFAANGKQGVLFKHLMSHSAGLSGMDEPVTAEDLWDREKISTLLAAQAPWWDPGTASGYHALTQGYLIGAVVERVTGKSLGAFFRDEIAEPLGADFHIGLAEEHDSRVADLLPPEALPVSAPAGSIAVRSFANPAADARAPRQAGWRRAEIPAANGHGNARAIARIQSILACGGEVDGHRFVSEETARLPLIEQTSGTDLVLGISVRWGLGFGLMIPEFPFSPSPNAYFWGGWGGSLVFVDPDERMSFSFAMNKMYPELLGDLRGLALTEALYQGLEGKQ